MHGGVDQLDRDDDARRNGPPTGETKL